MVPIVGEGMSGAMVEQVMDAMVKSIETRSAAALAAYQRVCQPAAGSLGGATREVLAGAAMPVLMGH
jgi:2-polyprenyl-6-methoxyphenol hydroxylase-like FAD-dependent oxidoreductase